MTASTALTADDLGAYRGRYVQWSEAEASHPQLIDACFRTRQSHGEARHVVGPG